ncbi:MAG: hypothetical protein OEW52_02530 [Thermoleophilia bacterium]|nr:hypothetical protein [Actinomycetota bacterium]MDH5224045.1 hypothetical protein [Actinomycetota bacterium]MDH5280008.1 hypothetical protein [Thermoleophilia bacterium]
MATPLRARALNPSTIVVLAVIVLAAASCSNPGLGSPVCRRGSSRIIVFQGPGGDCIPRNRAVGYQCEGRAPIIVFDAGGASEQRFLGGAFEVAVPALPGGAEVVGVGDGAQLVRVPDRPQLLYTTRGSSIVRWLALPRSSTLEAGPQAFMLGDSILDGGSSLLSTALPDWAIEIDALNGRGTSEGLSIAASRTAQDQVVVVELGTNDRNAASFAENAKQILSALRDVPFVLWQNVQGPPDVVPAAEINAAIAAAAGRRSNVSIADWDARVPDESLFDGVHPAAEHQDAEATLIAPMLQRWWSAVTGSPSCE